MIRQILLITLEQSSPFAMLQHFASDLNINIQQISTTDAPALRQLSDSIQEIFTIAKHRLANQPSTSPDSKTTIESCQQSKLFARSFEFR